jgi:hypothetical protein
VNFTHAGLLMEQLQSERAVMDIDDLRDQIWGYLFETKSSQSVAELAALAACDETTIRIATNHEWFAVSEDRVSIAYAAGLPGQR